MIDLKEYINEGIFDDDNLELTDLYSLIKDRIKTINYQYTSLGFTHFNDENACRRYIKDHHLETLKTVSGKEASTGKILINLLPAIFKNIIVNKNFIEHKDDDSYMSQSIKVSADFFKDNELIAKSESDNRTFKRLRKYLYIGVEMKKGALCVYYDCSDNLPNMIKPRPSSGHKGEGYVSIRFI